MLVPSGAVVKQFVQTSLHKLLARVGAALGEELIDFFFDDPFFIQNQNFGTASHRYMIQDASKG